MQEVVVKRAPNSWDPTKLQASHWKFHHEETLEMLLGRAGRVKELEIELEFPREAQISQGGPSTISSYPTFEKAHLG